MKKLFLLLWVVMLGTTNANAAYWDCVVGYKIASPIGAGQGNVAREIEADSRSSAERKASSSFTVNHCSWGSCKDRFVCSTASEDGGSENGMSCEYAIFKVQCSRQ